MKEPPKRIGLAKVVAFTPLDDRHRPTGNTKHQFIRKDIGKFSGLAICEYDDEEACEEGYYLLYCDHEWEAITDTWHATIDDAKEQAHFEFEGVKDTWKDAR